ncbi:MAG: extracellular solute-binding protein [Treponema sp.]|nr:extracellular solute-binding protein [Treponema sp.]MCL2272443.1 extracellular solute-binding protein [Treponema sp.]
MRRILLVIAGIVIISSMVFTSCGKGGGSRGDPNYPINITIFHETGNHPQPAANNPIYQYIKDKLNVTFTWDILVGDIAQRRGTMIAGGDYPDIMELRGNEWIDAGALIPLEDLIAQHGPNIRKHYNSIWDQMKSADGHTYYLVNFGVFQGIDHSPNYDQAAFWIQKDILAKAGYPKVVTLDDFFGLIESYYRANPTINGQPTIPFLSPVSDWRAFELWNPPNFLFGNPNDGNGVVDPATYEYKTFFTMDISKRWFQYFNRLNQRGLVDRTMFTDNHDQYSAKISSGRVLGQAVQGWQFMYSADMANRDRGENNRTMAPLPVVFDSSVRPWWRNVTIPNLLRGMGISVSAKDPVRIIRFINALLEEDVQKTINWGIEGQHWQYGSNGVPYRTQAQRDNWQNDNWQTLNRGRLMDDIFPKIQGSFSDGYPSDLGFMLSEREATLLPEDVALYKAYGVESTNALMDKSPRPNNPWFPTWNMPTPPDGSAAQIALARMEETMKRALPAMILAPPSDFERLWNAYVQEMTVTNRTADYEAYMQQQLDLRLNSMGITTPRR